MDKRIIIDDLCGIIARAKQEVDIRIAEYRLAKRLEGAYAELIADKRKASSAAEYFFIESVNEFAKNILNPDLKITEIKLRVTHESEHISISIIDNGIGLPGTVYGVSRSVDEVLNIESPFGVSRIISTQQKDGNFYRGKGRGLAQLADFFDITGLNREEYVTVSKTTAEGGTVVKLRSEIHPYSLLRKTYYEQAAVRVIETFNDMHYLSLSVAECKKIMCDHKKDLLLEFVEFSKSDTHALIPPCASLPVKTVAEDASACAEAFLPQAASVGSLTACRRLFRLSTTRGDDRLSCVRSGLGETRISLPRISKR